MGVLILKPFSLENSALTLMWRNNSRIRQNMINPAPIKKQDHLEFIENLASEEQTQYHVIAVDGRSVGSIYFPPLDLERPEWGVYLTDAVLIPGLFLVLVILAMDIVFKKYDRNFAQSVVLSSNLKSQRVNAFLGIKKVFDESVRLNGEDLTLYSYLIEKNEYARVKEKVMESIPKSARELLRNYYIED